MAEGAEMNKEQRDLTVKLIEELEEDPASDSLPSLVRFPAESHRYVAFMSRVDQSDKYFKIYDIKTNSISRRITHENMQDEAFAINHNAQVLVKCEADELEFVVCKIPDDPLMLRELQINYKSSTEDHYSDACDKKQTFKDRIYRDLHVYHMY